MKRFRPVVAKAQFRCEWSKIWFFLSDTAGVLKPAQSTTTLGLVSRGAPSRVTGQEALMLDLVAAVIITSLFAASIAYVHGCARLKGARA